MNSQKKIPELWSLYECAVQDPAYSVDVADDIYRRIFRKAPSRLREDFCGSFAVGREWVKRGRQRRAVGLDFSPDSAAQALSRNSELLTPEEQRRIEFILSDVRTVTRSKVDIILAENFSFFVLKQRKELLDYFKACYRSLDKNGVFVLDVIGGAGFVDTPRVERRFNRVAKPRAGMPKTFTHTWNQRHYDPATAFGLYTIGFEVGKKKIPDAFSYDWRVWTVPELRDCLADAGFDEVKLFWDGENKKPSLKEVVTIPNEWECWLSVLVGVKRK